MTDGTAAELLIERHGPVAVLTLNRPQAMNALSQSLIRSLSAAIVSLGRDETARVLVLTGRASAPSRPGST